MGRKRKETDSVFSLSKVKLIAQQDEDVGHLSKEATLTIASCTEVFLKDIITRSKENTKKTKSDSILTQHIKSVIQEEEKLDFLQEIVDRTKDEVLKVKEKKIKESSSKSNAKEKGADKLISDRKSITALTNENPK